MPLNDQLQEAGARASQRPVPQAPSYADLTSVVAKRGRRRRTVIGSSIAGLVLLVAVPLAASQVGGETDAPSLLTSAQDGEVPVESTLAPSTTAVPTTASVAPADPDTAPEPRTSDGHLAFGDLNLSVDVVSGEEAVTRAEEAEAVADETRQVDELTVWIKRDGDQTTVSALVEPTQFIEVTAPGELIDSAIDFLTIGDTFGNSFGELPDFDELEPGELPDLGEILPPEVLERFENGDLFDMFREGEFDSFFEEHQPA